jgi:Aldehyde dehydrogenase family
LFDFPNPNNIVVAVVVRAKKKNFQMNINSSSTISTHTLYAQATDNNNIVYYQIGFAIMSALKRLYTSSLLSLKSYNRPASPIQNIARMASNYLVDQKEYAFLQQLGLERTNAGVFDGKWSGSGPIVKSVDPATGLVIAEVKTGTTEDLEACVRSATAAYEEWKNIPAPQRGDIIRQVGDELRKFREPLGKLISLEMGKIVPEGVGEVQEFIDICDYAVGLSRTYAGQILPSERKEHVIIENWNPLGLVGVISAFNFPCAVFGWNAAIALVSMILQNLKRKFII